MYLQTLRATFPGQSDLALELMCAADCRLQKLTGRTEHQHRMSALKLLFPSRVEHEWRERAMRSFYEAKIREKKEILWLGSSNSNKTGSMADLLLELWWEHPESTSIYITSPYEDATETGLWARILEQFDEATGLHPWLPGKVKASENMIVMYDRNPLSFIKVVTVDKVGKLVGKKSKNFLEGIMIIAGDEMPEFKSAGQALRDVLKNIRSVPNFYLLGAGNFADINDLLGVLAEPDIEGSYESLNVDYDQQWDTRRGGIAIRFDGHQSPNLRAGHDFLPFVTTKAYLADLAKTEGGTRTPGYYRYGRSFPMLDFNEFTVTNAVKVKAGGAYEKLEWSSDPVIFGAHCDPGFGGDPCILSFWRCGTAFEYGQPIQVWELLEAPMTIPLEVGKKDAAGNDIIIDDQIALACKAELAKRKIPHSHFSFDGSMRAGIVQSMMRIIGVSVVAIDAGGPATKRVLSAVKQVVDPSEKVEPSKRKIKTAREEFSNFATEMLFAASSAIDSRQLRGLQLSREAVSQLCTRRWRWNGKRREVEPKVSRESGAREKNWGYKSHSGGKSPNESDSIVGGIENARRLGFKLNGVAVGQGGIIDMLDEMRRAADVRSFVEAGYREALPAGTLHSMQAETASNGRLNS